VSGVTNGEITSILIKEPFSPPLAKFCHNLEPFTPSTFWFVGRRKFEGRQSLLEF
jgi:hypothetical protein